MVERCGPAGNILGILEYCTLINPKILWLCLPPLRKDLTTPRGDYIVQDMQNLLNRIIVHFEQYPLENIKHLDFLEFKKAIKLISNGEHLTRAGMDKVKASGASRR
jgi:hypothetical protein